MLTRKELIESLQKGNPEELIFAEITTTEVVLETAKERGIELSQEDAESILEDYANHIMTHEDRPDSLLKKLIMDYKEETDA